MGAAREPEREKEGEETFPNHRARKLRHPLTTSATFAPPHFFSPGHPQSILTVLSPGAQSLIPSSPHSAPSFTPRTPSYCPLFPRILGILLSLALSATAQFRDQSGFPKSQNPFTTLEALHIAKPPVDTKARQHHLSRKAATTILQPHKYSLVVPQARRCVVDAQEHY